MASGADDVLQQALIVDSIQQALTGTTLAIALSARPREFGPPADTPRVAAEYMATLLNHDLNNEVAWIFGNERYGLPNHIVECCQRLLHIPANPEYSSLNLAQAIQLIAYEARIALQTIDDQANHLLKKESPINRARNEDIEALFTHLEQALIALKFLNPEQPKKLMSRLRQLFARSHLEVEEVNILRGIAKAILQRKHG
jgi:tRNA/rRNA methyltransferase